MRIPDVVYKRVQRIRYRTRYEFKKLCQFLGFCPECGNKLNTFPSGRKSCPECGR